VLEDYREVAPLKGLVRAQVGSCQQAEEDLCGNYSSSTRDHRRMAVKLVMAVNLVESISMVESILMGMSCSYDNQEEA